MKKAISISLILMLVLSMTFTGCSDSDSGDSGEEIKWAVVVGGTLGDLSFNDSAYRGLSEIEENNSNFSFDIMECADDATKYDDAYMNYADTGEYEIIWAASYTQCEPAEKSVVLYPDQKFGFYDAEPVTPTDNTYAITYSQNDGSFLVGAIAALVSETGVIGAIGGSDTEVINDFIVGYIYGAQYVASETKIAVSYVGSFTDIGKMKELTLAQYAQGADITFQVAGVAGQGMFEAARDNGKYAIGVDSDQAAIYQESDPELAAVIMTSMMKNVDVSMVYAYEQIRNGTANWGGTDALGILEGGVGYCDNEIYQSVVSADIRAEIEELEQKVVDGELTVETVFDQEVGWMSDLRDSVMP